MNDKDGRLKSSDTYWKWGAGAVAALGLLFGVWHLERIHRTAAPTTPQAAARIKPALTSSPESSFTHSPATASIPRKPGKTNFCGFGEVPLDTNDPSAPFRYLNAQTEKTEARWLSTLLDSGNLRARATGLLLKNVFTDGKSDQTVTQEARDELVQLAVGANDPAIYALALYKCNTYSGAPQAGACPQISWSGWARLDPDNAAPWLNVAGSDRAKGDSAAEADAFAHAAAAHRYESYNASFFAFAEPELPQDVTPLERTFLSQMVIGVEAASSTPQYSMASKHCSGAMQDSRLRQQCSAVAELLLAKGNTFLDLMIGESIGKRVGWPEKRIESLKLDRNSMMELLMRLAPVEEANPWSCETVGRINEFMAARSRLGEIGALREMRERSGESVLELARAYDEDMEKIQRRAQKQAAQDHQETQP